MLGRSLWTAVWLGCLCVSPLTAGPLHEAAKSGDLTSLAHLLEQGSALEERDATGETALLAAALAGNPEIVAELISRGASVAARNDRGMTPLHAAAFGGNLEVLELIVEAGAAVNDAENRFQVTPLIVAAEENHPDLVSYLIENGGDVELQERHGYTALTRAGFKENWETVELLLKAGAECQPEEKVGAWSTVCQERMAALAQ